MARFRPWRSPISRVAGNPYQEHAKWQNNVQNQAGKLASQRIQNGDWRGAQSAINSVSLDIQNAQMMEGVQTELGIQAATMTTSMVPVGSVASASANALGKTAAGAAINKTGVSLAAGMASRMGGGASGAATNAGGSLVHMSKAADEILTSGRLGLPSNIYAGPASNAGRSGWALTGRTGLPPGGNYGAVPIPAAAEGAFSKVFPVGPFTAWQRMTGQQYTARGVLDLGTGAFTRSGVNWNQAAAYAGDAAFTGAAVGTGAYLHKNSSSSSKSQQKTKP